ncbi:ribonuclease-III-like-domain-containing protein [Cantharellus anzutake]|uniref:ribonuclease-III-like-domain-containing protein n=1 Tax=Cantharellus anzutake TaxID=1750568 RepID=UPI001906F744|nr:ribonuclease-III-like-domain-containing protein [Cantharellus anzutake]KAF8327259.1 ribonuclease-III-like-domain-containing protein [Cantharellus anzutake]
MTSTSGIARTLHGTRNVTKTSRSRYVHSALGHAPWSVSCQTLVARPSLRVVPPFLQSCLLASNPPLPSSSFSTLSPLQQQYKSSELDDDVELDPVTPSSLEAARSNGEWAVSYLESQFPPLQFPPDLAKRVLTHSSYRKGAQTYGHNTRLAFMGRRVMDAYFLMSLQASLPESVAGPSFDGGNAATEEVPYTNFQELTENVLDTHTLGRHVGNEWGIGKVMRWTSAKNHLASNPGAVHAGRIKVQGTAVEATVGGIFHQFGGVAAYVAFHTRVLPNLVPVLPASLHERVEDVCYQLGGRNAPLRPDISEAPMSPRGKFSSRMS